MKRDEIIRTLKESEADLWRDNLGENFAAFGRAILAVAAG